MFLFKVYNDDTIRKWNNFPTLKDPMVLENTLLRILNELFLVLGLSQEKEFNIYDPKFYNLYLTYFTTSNFNSWGELPLGYIYNDMIRLIQNQNTSNNFIMTLESITFEKCNYEMYYKDPSLDMYGELITSYILENYMISYGYIQKHNNGVLVIRIPDQNNIVYTTYIISVGFDKDLNSNWFENKRPGSIPSARFNSLRSLIKYKYGPHMDDDIYKITHSESFDGSSRSTQQSCLKYIQQYDISKLKKKSIYDTEVKYGNYPIDYNWLNLIDGSIPATMYQYKYNGSKMLVNKFNQDETMGNNYKLLKKENELIEIEKKKNK